MKRDLEGNRFTVIMIAQYFIADIQKMIIVIFNNHLLIKKKIYKNIKIKKFKKNKKFN